LRGGSVPIAPRAAPPTLWWAAHWRASSAKPAATMSIQPCRHLRLFRLSSCAICCCCRRAHRLRHPPTSRKCTLIHARVAACGNACGMWSSVTRTFGVVRRPYGASRCACGSGLDPSTRTTTKSCLHFHRPSAS
ncbi:hypothetical protein GGF49_006263, partial [Coemansia sp. RSA 1853]